MRKIKYFFKWLFGCNKKAQPLKRSYIDDVNAGYAPPPLPDRSSCDRSDSATYERTVDTEEYRSYYLGIPDMISDLVDNISDSSVSSSSDSGSSFDFGGGDGGGGGVSGDW